MRFLASFSSSWFRSARDDPKLFPLLRWATLGLHHDWNTKVYSPESVTAFPSDLASLADNIVGVVALSAGLSRLGSWTPPFRAEAAIVNFYPMDATLSGHTDHSEQNLDAPLLSISFGTMARVSLFREIA
jgi:alkylated DNA repair protein alkB family protein 1